MFILASCLNARLSSMLKVMCWGLRLPWVGLSNVMFSWGRSDAILKQPAICSAGCCAIIRLNGQWSSFGAKKRDRFYAAKKLRTYGPQRLGQASLAGMKDTEYPKSSTV